MSDPDGWSTPEGWGPRRDPDRPTATDPSPAGEGQAPAYGQPPTYGQAPTYGQSATYGQPPPPPGYGPPGGWGPQGQPWGAIRPEVKPGIVALRPLGLGELLDGAVGIIRRYPRPALGLSAVVALVSALLNIAVQVVAFQPLLELDQTALERGDTAQLTSILGSLGLGAALAIVVYLLSAAIMTGAITAVVGRAVLGEPLGVGEVWRIVRARLLPLLGLSLLILLAVSGVVVVATVVAAVVIGFGGGVGAILGVPLVLASIVAAVYLFGRWSLAPCALVLERTGVTASLRRSGVLVRRSWWRIFGILLLTAVIGGVVSGIVQVPFAAFGAGGLGGLLDPGADPLTTQALVAGAIGSTLAATIITPFTTGVRALLYVDRRMRAEGLDVTLTAAAGERGPAR